MRQGESLTLTDVSAVVCTRNSIASIEACLRALRSCEIGELIVVDASSTDGTREIASALADLVLTDPGAGLGEARNLGIRHTTGELVLNVGSDNILSPEALQTMIKSLSPQVLGVGAQTRVATDSYLGSCINAWWRTRFRVGIASVIGTPSLMRGDLLRDNPFSTHRVYSDDEELCTRWRQTFGGSFVISSATVMEVGKSTPNEIIRRCKMYGASDYEVFSAGARAGWTYRRKIRSLLHPARVDLVQPLARLGVVEAVWRLPFFLGFATTRYAGWAGAAVRRRALS